MENYLNTKNSQIDNRFGSWTVLKDLGTRIKGTYFDKRVNRSYPFYRRFYLVKCKCGNEKEVDAQSLESGQSTQCRNCSMENNQHNLVHGMYKSSEYHTWHSMIHRCINPRAQAYKNYGGRGIEVCDRWLHSFENFLADMGKKPGPEYSIDRINNDGNYEPGNCRWGTRKEQRANQRKKHSKIKA